MINKYRKVAKILFYSLFCLAISINLPSVSAEDDVTPPTVSIFAPLMGTTVSGTITVISNAADPESGINRVEFFRQGAATPFGADTTPGNETPLGTPSYSATFNTMQIPNGVLILQTVAYDNAGNSTASANRFVEVKNKDSIAPKVSITSPNKNATVSNPVTITASASDQVGIYRVEFYKDGESTPFATDYDAPYSTSVTLISGSHSVSAKAYDFVLNVTTSRSVNLNVSN